MQVGAIPSRSCTLRTQTSSGSQGCCWGQDEVTTAKDNCFFLSGGVLVQHGPRSKQTRMLALVAFRTWAFTCATGDEDRQSNLNQGPRQFTRQALHVSKCSSAALGLVYWAAPADFETLAAFSFSLSQSSLTINDDCSCITCGTSCMQRTVIAQRESWRAALGV